MDQEVEQSDSSEISERDWSYASNLGMMICGSVFAGVASYSFSSNIMGSILLGISVLWIGGAVVSSMYSSHLSYKEKEG